MRRYVSIILSSTCAIKGQYYLLPTYSWVVFLWASSDVYQDACIPNGSLCWFSCCGSWLYVLRPKQHSSNRIDSGCKWIPSRQFQSNHTYKSPTLGYLMYCCNTPTLSREFPIFKASRKWSTNKANMLQYRNILTILMLVAKVPFDRSAATSPTRPEFGPTAAHLPRQYRLLFPTNATRRVVPQWVHWWLLQLSWDPPKRWVS